MVALLELLKESEQAGLQEGDIYGNDFELLVQLDKFEYQCLMKHYCAFSYLSFSPSLSLTHAFFFTLLVNFLFHLGKMVD